MADSLFRVERSYKNFVHILESEAANLSEHSLRSLCKRVQGTLRDLRSEINARRPISSLPVDLLIRILEELIFAETEAFPHGFGLFWRPSFKDSVALIPVSQTCRRLRSAAHELTSWWRHIAYSAVGTTALRTRSQYNLCLSRSDALPLVVVTNPGSRSGSILWAFDPSVSSRIEELHLLRTHRSLVESLEEMLHCPTHRPLARLKALSCGSENNGMWDDFILALNHSMVPVLEHLCLEGVGFCLLDLPFRQNFPRLTNLVLARSAFGNIHTVVEALIRMCPSIKSVALSLLSPHIRILGLTAPLQTPISLRRLTLHDLGSCGLRFYLSLFPPQHPIALQLLTDTTTIHSFQYEPVLKERLHRTVRRLRIAIFPDAWRRRAKDIGFSVTFATSKSAVRIASNVGMVVRSHYFEPDVWLQRLLSDAAADLSSVREVWLTNVAAPFTAPLTFFNTSATAALRRLPMLDTVVLVTVEHPINGPGNAYRPDLSVLPNTEHPDFVAVHLKTLRLVYCDASPPPAYPLCRGTVWLGFRRMLEQLASRAYRYLEHLVVQTSPRFEIENAEVVLGELRACFQTVTVERIAEMPQMHLPACCVEPDSGPGGSCVDPMT